MVKRNTTNTVSRNMQESIKVTLLHGRGIAERSEPPVVDPLAILAGAATMKEAIV